MQDEFLDKNYELFTEDEENRICYMDIFNEYTAIIERIILDRLKASVCDEEMNRFMTELRWAETMSNKFILRALQT